MGRARTVSVPDEVAKADFAVAIGFCPWQPLHLPIGGQLFTLRARWRGVTVFSGSQELHSRGLAKRPQSGHSAPSPLARSLVARTSHPH